MNLNPEQQEIKTYLITTIGLLMGGSKTNYYYSGTSMFDRLIWKYHSLGGTRLKLSNARLCDNLGQEYDNEYKFWDYVIYKTKLKSKRIETKLNS